MRARLPAILTGLGAAALAFGLEAQARIYDGPWNWEHPNELRLTQDETFPHTPYQGEWQTHSYYWLGWLEAGYVVVMSPFEWRYGAIHAWGLYVIVRDPRGRVFSWDGKLGAGLPEVAASGMHVSSGGTRFDSGDGVHHWVVDVPGFSCDLVFTNVLPAWKPGSGVVWYDGRHYSAYSLPAPWADLSGTMTVDGKTVDAAGQCLLDASESLMPPTRPNASCQAARVFSSPGTPREDRWFLSMLTTISHAGYGSLRQPMLMVAHGERWVFTTMRYSLDFVEMATIDDPPYPYPARMAVRARDGGYALEGVFTNEPPYWVTDIFQRLPKVIRTVASWFVKRPVIYRNMTRFEGMLTFPDGSTTALELSGQAEFMETR